MCDTLHGYLLYLNYVINYVRGLGCYTYNYDSLAMGCLLRLGGPETLCVVSQVRTKLVFPTRLIVHHILLEVSLLDQPLDLFLELVTIFDVMHIDFVELTPSTWFMIHYICLQFLRYEDVVHVKNLMLDLFTTMKLFIASPYLLNAILSLMERGVIILLLVV